MASECQSSGSSAENIYTIELLSLILTDFDMKSFDESIRIIRTESAAFFAADLFMECFGSPFPLPRDNCGLPIPTPPENWRQYVAFYRWSESHFEPVGFCNFIRHGEVYLEGGMCVKNGFYRRLPRHHWQECKSRGGIAQLLMEQAATELTDCVAWFGYCGDAMAFEVDKRVGYVETSHPNLIVKWFQQVSADRQKKLVDSIAQIGPF